MRKCILVMDDEVSAAITALEGILLRGETQGAETEEGCVEMEEGSVETEEATFFAVYNYNLATDESSERYPMKHDQDLLPVRITTKPVLMSLLTRVSRFFTVVEINGSPLAQLVQGNQLLRSLTASTMGNERADCCSTADYAVQSP